MSSARDIPALPFLVGARVQRVDGPKPSLFSFAIFHEGARSYLVVAVSKEARGVGLCAERPSGDPASSFVQRLRRLIENARLSEATWLTTDAQPERATALRMTFAKGERRTTLIADFDRTAPALLLLGNDQQVVGSSDTASLRLRGLRFGQPFVPSSHGGIAMPMDLAALSAASLTLSEQRGEQRIDRVRAELLKQTHALLKRAQRKVIAIEGDLGRAAEAPQLREHANLILCHLSDIPRGASEVTLRDDAVDPPRDVTLKLNPAKDANANAQLMFERARKVERGMGIASQRLEETRVEVARLSALEQRIKQAQEDSELDALSFDLGHSAQPEPQKKNRPQARTPYHVFESAGGARILVGKGAADNDTLTLTIARPHDHWLHVRGMQGSHVVVPVERGATLPPEVLIDAAHLAAHYSKARGESIVDVIHTERRYIRKPKGAAPGSVNVDREKVLRLRVEPERLARLIKS